MLNIDQLINDLKRDEGYCQHAYLDSRGFWTIGSGILIDERGGGITKAENDMLMRNRIQPVIDKLTVALPWFTNIGDVRQRALCNMAYQMGIAGLMGFKTMLRLMENGAWRLAAAEALDSRWARQTPNRAKLIAEMIANG